MFANLVTESLARETSASLLKPPKPPPDGREN